MLRILRRVAISCVVAGFSMLPISPASARVVEGSAHCLPAIPDSVGCWVKCIVQQGTLKGCDEYAPFTIACTPQPTCEIVGDVWELRP